MFQSAPGFWAGRNWSAPPPWQSGCSFNPLPAFGPGETLDSLGQFPLEEVSIRSRLLGREKHTPTMLISTGTTFQSAPGFWAGRNTLQKWPPRRIICFNPLPAFGPGETRRTAGSAAPARCFNPLPAFGPGETPTGLTVNAALYKFQSAPGFWAGRNPGRTARISPISRFNPLPAFGPGETFLDRGGDTLERVSIRSRLLGREKLQEALRDLDRLEFQSAPGFWAGRNWPWRWRRGRRSKFQSAPGFWAGRNPAARWSGSRAPSFNPLPAFGPGETGADRPHRGLHDVSIRSRLLGREKPQFGFFHVASLQFQSAPGFWAGRNRLDVERRGRHQRFQSAPGFWAGRNREVSCGGPDCPQFQSAPGFWAGRNFQTRLIAYPTLLFQSAPGFWAGRNAPRRRRAARRAWFQSAPGFWAGRNPMP